MTPMTPTMKFLLLLLFTSTLATHHLSIHQFSASPLLISDSQSGTLISGEAVRRLLLNPLHQSSSPIPIATSLSAQNSPLPTINLFSDFNFEQHSVRGIVIDIVNGDPPPLPSSHIPPFTYELTGKDRLRVPAYSPSSPDQISSILDNQDSLSALSVDMKKPSEVDAFLALADSLAKSPSGSTILYVVHGDGRRGQKRGRGRGRERGRGRRRLDNDDGNDDDNYDSEPDIFTIQYVNIFLWTSFGLVLILLYAIYLMVVMPFDEDSMLFGDYTLVLDGAGAGAGAGAGKKSQ
ncbi:hypothetical protein ScalyP_jg7337 [Parmales sp. scaly parma]|nr:hypothetical protein ScalyP_jg7337 [Parmales sp. scaly parma]